MAIEQVDKLEASGFLERFRETPYPQEEKIFDKIGIVVPIFVDALSYFLPLFTLRHSYWYLTNRVPVKEFKIAHILIPKTMEQIVAHPNHSEILKAKLIHIVKTTEQLSKKMGLGQVIIALSANTSSSAFIYSTSVLNLIVISSNALSLDNKQLEYIIAHELAHLHHQDSLKRLIFRWMVLACNLIAFRYFTPGRAIGIGILTRIIAGPIGRRMMIYQERAADAKALMCLNSNEGMIGRIYQSLKNNYTFKHTPTEELQKKFPRLTLEKIEQVKNNITSHGNNKVDIIHPPLTERLAHALSFKPV